MDEHQIAFRDYVRSLPGCNAADERTTTTRLSDDGLRLIVVERWLDRQVSPPRWRSKNWHRKLAPNDVEYYRQRAHVAPTVANDRNGA